MLYLFQAVSVDNSAAIDSERGGCGCPVSSWSAFTGNKQVYYLKKSRLITLCAIFISSHVIIMWLFVYSSSYLPLNLNLKNSFPAYSSLPCWQAQQKESCWGYWPNLVLGRLGSNWIKSAAPEQQNITWDQNKVVGNRYLLDLHSLAAGPMLSPCFFRYLKSLWSKDFVVQVPGQADLYSDWRDTLDSREK